MCDYAHVSKHKRINTAVCGKLTVSDETNYSSFYLITAYKFVQTSMTLILIY